MGLHDHIFRVASESPDEIAMWVSKVLSRDLGREVRLVDLRPLTTEHAGPADGKRSSHRADALYEGRIDGTSVLIILLMEHQSRPDRNLPRRAVMYQATALRAWAERGEGGPMPALLTWVVYTGARPWTGELDLRDMVGLPPELAGLREYILGQRLRLVDLRRDRFEREAADGSLRVVWEIFGRRVASGLTILREEAARAREAIERRGPLWLQAILGYVVETEPGRVDPEEFEAVIEALGAPEEVGMSWAWQLREALEKGIEKGIEKGVEKGLHEGRQAGALHTLRRLAQRRLGPPSPADDARLAEASAAELDRWTERLFDVATWDDLFAS